MSINYITGIPIEATGPNTASFLDYNDPIVVHPGSLNVSSLSDAVTPPPQKPSTTTIIVLSTTPSDVDLQVRKPTDHMVHLIFHQW